MMEDSSAKEKEFVSAGFAVPFNKIGTLAGMPLPGVAPVPGTFLPNALAASGITVTPFFLQHAAPAVSKQNQTKIQDELVIAREIVINDAESSVWYKLTKRQTQEEIQRFTGAVVITRGKYHPPNAPPDGEKPLYLHISAATHLKETAERILAVDRAAAMIEELLKHGQSSLAGTSPFKEAAMNGVKDQYMNHIMNETGATVTLRGCGSGNSESLQGEVLSGLLVVPKNTTTTAHILVQISSSKVYGAVPPPVGVQSSATEKNLNSISAAGLTSMSAAAPVQPVAVPGVTAGYSQGMAVGMPTCGPTQANSVGYPQPLVTRGTNYIGYGGIYPQATPLQQVALTLRQSSPISSAVVPATSVASTDVPTVSAVSTVTKSSVRSTLHSEKEQQPPQKRKFQELPAGSKGSSRLNQVQIVYKFWFMAVWFNMVGNVKNDSSILPILELRFFNYPNPEWPSHGAVSSMVNVIECAAEVAFKGSLVSIWESESLNPNKLLGDLRVRNVSTMHAPRTPIHPSSNGMPPPPPKTLLPPPPPPKVMMPPPKFMSSTPPGKSHVKNKANSKDKLDAVPDTLMQLMSYGDEDDDSEESSDNYANANGVRKPCWAL
ncbi:hypothetical protein V6N13_086791 [Hibiscus sabdariffa]